jgi:GxxExxY protein
LTDQELTHSIIGAAIEVHRTLAPGLLESAYEECLAHELARQHVPFERQKPVPVVCKGVKLECGYRIDLLVDGRLVVELKAVEISAPIHDAVLLTFLRLSGCKIGLLINFHAAVLKDRIRRRVLGYEEEQTHRRSAEDTEKEARWQSEESEYWLPSRDWTAMIAGRR